VPAALDPVGSSVSGSDVSSLRHNVAAATPTEAISDPTHPRTRRQNNIRKLKMYTDGTIRYACLASSPELESVAAAMSDDKWQKAMDEEYKALIQNKT
jgi:hypothetical protein